MNPSQAYWAAIEQNADIDTLDALNDARCDFECREMRQRQLIDGHKLAIIETYTPFKVLETADV